MNEIQEKDCAGKNLKFIPGFCVRTGIRGDVKKIVNTCNLIKTNETCNESGVKMNNGSIFKCKWNPAKCFDTLKKQLVSPKR